MQQVSSSQVARAPIADDADGAPGAIDLDRAFRRHASYVAAIAHRLLGRDDEVDDVVQDVFVAAAARPMLRDPEALRGWLATVTVRVARRRLLLRRLRGFVGLDVHADHARIESPDASPEARALLARVHQLLDALPVDHRIAWTLHHVEGETLETVAALQGCSLATVKRRIAAAQAALDAALAGRRTRRHQLVRAGAIVLLLLAAAVATAAVIRHRAAQLHRAPGAPCGASEVRPAHRRLSCAPPREPMQSEPIACLMPTEIEATAPIRREKGTALRGRKRENDMKTFQRILSGAVLAPLLTTSAAAGPPPSAPPPRAPRAQVEIPAIPTNRTAPRPAPAKPAAAEAPALRAEELRHGEDKVQEVTLAQIQVMQRLLDNTAPGDPERADLLFRLAGLYEEQRRYFTFRARELDQPIWEAKQRNDATGAERLAMKQNDFQLRAEKSLLEAVKRYLEVADHYDGYARMDEVLFDLAYLLGEVKHEEAARTYFKRLIKDYPNSRYIPDAYLAFGDYFFEKRDIENALRLYERVAQFPESRVYAYARYKVGWCYLNLNDWKKALQTFVEVADLAHRGQGAGTRSNRIALEREAKKDAVRAYAHVGEPGKAWNFFQKIGGEYAPTMLEQLGELYNAQGQFEPAITVLHQLMAAFPSSPKLCAWQYDVVRNTLSRTGAKADPAAATEAARLAAVEDKLRGLGAVKPEVLAECHESAAGTLRELATTWHREAQKTGEKVTYEMARRAYDEYLSRYPNEKDVYDLGYYRAELLSALAEKPGGRAIYCDAAEAYSGVVRRDPSARGRWLRDAAFAAVIAWKGCLDLDDSRIPVETAGTQDAHRKGKLDPLPIPEKWQKMIDAFHDYLSHVPASPERPIVEYRLGLAEYDFNRFAEAGKWFQDVARRYPEIEVGVYAAELYFDCLAAEKRTKELAAAVAEHCENPVLAKNPAFGAHCRVIEVSLGREQAERLEQAGRHREAGEIYLKLAEKFPEYAQLDELYYNGHVNLEKAHRLGMSIRALQTLIDKRPESPLAKKGLFLLGRTYQQLAAYEAAAEHYEKFADRFPGEKDAPSALLTAAFFRRGLGQHDKSIEDTESFIKRYGPRAGYTDKAAGAVFVEAQVFEQREDWPRLERHLAAYLKDWNGRGGVDRQILAHVRLGEIAWRASCPVSPVNGACIEVHRPRPGEHGRRKQRNGVDKTCGPGIAITVHERNPARAREAQAHFAEALRLWKNGAALQSLPEGEDRAQRAAEMTWFAAEARMAQADSEYEAFLKMKMPQGLDFTRSEKKATARFLAWFEGKSRQLEKAKKVYEEVILFKQAHFAIAAAARVGQLYQDLAAQLTTAEVPAIPAPAGVDPREWAQLVYDKFCDGIMDKVDALEAKAIDALDRCLGKSTELSWYNEWSSLCEAELHQLKPHDYPIATEIRAQPGYVAFSAGNSSEMPLARTLQ